MMSRLSAFRKDRRGNITIMSALMMPGLIGVGALVLDLGYQPVDEVGQV